MDEPTREQVGHRPVRQPNYSMVVIAISSVVAALAITAGTVFGVIHNRVESKNDAHRAYATACESRATTMQLARPMYEGYHAREYEQCMRRHGQTP